MCERGETVSVYTLYIHSPILRGHVEISRHSLYILILLIYKYIYYNFITNYIEDHSHKY